MQPTQQSSDLLTLDRVMRFPLTIASESLVVDAIALLNQSQTDCVLIVEDWQLLGIFTERDVVRLAASGRDLSKLKLFEAIARPVITMTQSNSQDPFTALSLMRQHQIRHLPIVDKHERLVGLVTQTSLLQSLAARAMSGSIEALQQPVVAPITELKQEIASQQIEAILNESEAKFQAVFNSALDAIAIGDDDGRFIDVNPSACELFGLSKAELLDCTVADFVEPGIDFNELRQSFREQKYLAGELRLHLNDGVMREVEYTATADFLPHHHLSIIRDISARKRAEAQLRESEQRYVTLTQAVPVGIFRSDPQGHCLYVNDRWSQITGLSLQEAWQEGWTQALHPDDRERVFTEWYRCAQQNLSFQSEYRFRRADGVITWVFGQAVAERGIDNEIIGYVGTITDISDRKRGEEALRQYERIVSATPDGVALVNRDYTFRLINQTYLSLHGKGYDKIIGHTLGELLGEDTFTGIIKPFMDRSLAGETIRYEAWFNYARAGRRFISVTYAPYIEVDGTISGVVVNTRDLSELKQAEEKIREQAALLDITTDAILVRNLDNQILFWNNGAERLYGWSSQEAVGKNVSELIYKEITPQPQAALNTVVETGSWQGELSKVDKQGKEIIVASRWTLVRDETGQPKSILSVDTDITVKKKIAAQFLRTQRLESIGTLAAGIAHDLNNILAPILMSVQLLQIRYPADRNLQLLQLLENNVKRGAALVNQVLSFARGLEGERTIVQLKHSILEIANLVKETFPKSIEFAADIAPDLWTVSADATQLHQVLMNFCVNARDAMPNGGTLSISAANLTIDESYVQMNIEAKVGPYVAITVADTGTGMPPEIVERSFEPFFTTKEIGKGTGLGLSTALGIIKSHGGFIEVHSEVGQGTQFKVYLPTSQQTATQLGENSEILTGQGEMVLVVDDEAAIVEITSATLGNYNYKVLTANDGIEAIALYAQHQDKINVVLIDMMMPEMDGFTAIRTLQTMKPAVKIVATSGLAANDKVNLAISAGAKAFLSKPYTTQALLKTLHEVLSAK